MPSKRSDSGKWRGRGYVYDPATGRVREVTKTFDRKRDAAAWESQKRVELRRRPRQSRPDLLLSQYINGNLDRMLFGLSKHTDENYRGHVRLRILPEMGNLKLRAISVDHVESAQSIWVGSVSVSAVQGTRNCLSRVFATAIRDGIVVDNPVLKARRLKATPPRRSEYVLSELECRKLIAIVSNYDENFDLVAYVAVAIYTGMRAAEIEALQNGDLDLQNRRIYVRRAMAGGARNVVATPKSGEGRAIPIAEPLRQLLAGYQPQVDGGERTDWLLHRADGQRLGHVAALRAIRWKVVTEQLGHPQLRFHDLRATAIVSWLRAGIPMHIVRQWAGHADLKTTQRYVRLAGTDDAVALAALDRHFRDC